MPVFCVVRHLTEADLWLFWNHCCALTLGSADSMNIDRE